jgi:hypothetical protein
MKEKTHRILKAHGSILQGTDYDVSILESKVNIENGDHLFSFSTPVCFHGSYSVTITVHRGQLSIDRWTATYPALFNNTLGHAVFKQPILYPMLFVRNNSLFECSKIKITAGETLSYEHLMFNGPTMFLIKTVNAIQENQTVYVGDLITKDYAPGFTVVGAEYAYNKVPSNLSGGEDLTLLKKKALDKINSKSNVI